jgi:hypothetical protein
MRRTTIVLPDRLHDALREEAFRTRVSMAHLIRQRLEVRTKVKTARGPAKDPLLEVAGIGSDGHLAEGIDAALYGDE